MFIILYSLMHFIDSFPAIPPDTLRRRHDGLEYHGERNRGDAGLLLFTSEP